MVDTVPRDLLERFFEEPGGHVIMDEDLRVVEVGQEYLRLTLGKREDLMGKLYVNTITEPNPARHELAIDAVRRLSAAALKTHTTQKYPAIRMDIKTPDGHVEERWWEGAYIPLAVDGRTFIVHRVEDVTHWKVTQRKLDAQRRSNYILYGLVVALMGVAFFLYSGRSETNRRIAASGRNIALSTCRQVQSINQHLYVTIHTSLKNVFTPGTVEYKFYHQHPDLRYGAIQELHSELQTFTPNTC